MNILRDYRRTDCYPRPRKVAPLKLPQNFGRMGCASSQGAAAVASSGLEKAPIDSMDDGNGLVDMPPTYPPAEAFEILLNDENVGDENNDSLIRKHPPKRLQRLVEQATTVPATTIEDLEEKLAKAEVRRQQYIQQKIDNIVTVKNFGREEGNGEDDSGKADDDHEEAKEDDNEEKNGDKNSFGTRMDGDGSVDCDSENEKESEKDKCTEE